MQILNNQSEPTLRYDLHSHTTRSDGTLTPQELILRAQIKNIDFLAITDHDTINGLNEAKQAIIESNSSLKLINGVEISTQWHGYEIHIVGLCIDPDNQALQNSLLQQQSLRIERAKEIGNKLARKGIDNMYEYAAELAGEGSISRNHFAKALVDKAVVSSFNSAFKKYLGKGKSAYVTPNWMSIEAAISIIQSAGGLSVLAHPTAYKMSNKWLTRLVDEFAGWQGDAVEVGNNQQSPNQKRHLSDLARKREMYSSQGSDFHGPTKWNELGRHLSLTDKCLPIWQHSNWKVA